MAATDCGRQSYGHPGGLASSQHARDNRRWDASSVQATVRKEGNGYVLSGCWHYVPDGHTAGLLILAAREQGSRGDDGVRLFAIAADSAGVQRHWTPAMDQTRRQVRIEIDNLFVAADCCLGGAGASDWPALEQILQLASIAVAAEQAGGARQVMELTIDYTRERVQFGRTIASFQAIKHRAADMMLQVEKDDIDSLKTISYEMKLNFSEDFFDIDSGSDNALGKFKTKCSYLKSAINNAIVFKQEIDSA